MAYQKAGCPGTRKISAAAAEASFAADMISHQAVANILNGKSFPVWVKLQALVAALLILGRSESIKPELERFRDLWVDAHYGETASEPPIVPVLDELLNRSQPGRRAGPTAEAPRPPEPLVVEPEKAAAAQPVRDGDVSDAPATAPGSSSDDSRSAEQEFRAVFMESAWPGPDMFSIEHIAGRLIVKLNVAHPMGASIAEAMERDEETSRMLWLLLFSWARMEDEIPSARQRARAEDMRRDWSRYAGLFMDPTDETD
ncbi:hypothetical protein [Streptomyces sp. NPDC057336]|uniref:hypothetical protein n=1 Tax=Streptomyces sp. NPDC057336 TaxID=3346102 RepID=UPI0036433914